MLNKLASSGGGGAGSTAVNIAPSGSAAGTQTWDIGRILSWGISAILAVAGIIFFFMLLMGGITWLTSGGDKQATESARNRITAALIGLIIVFGAFAIIQILESAFAINLLNFDIGSI